LIIEDSEKKGITKSVGYGVLQLHARFVKTAPKLNRNG
jgi:hypothetical protein